MARRQNCREWQPYSHSYSQNQPAHCYGAVFFVQLLMILQRLAPCQPRLFRESTNYFNLSLLQNWAIVNWAIELALNGVSSKWIWIIQLETLAKSLRYRADACVQHSARWVKNGRPRYARSVQQPILSLSLDWWRNAYHFGMEITYFRVFEEQSLATSGKLRAWCLNVY